MRSGFIRLIIGLFHSLQPLTFLGFRRKGRKAGWQKAPLLCGLLLFCLTSFSQVQDLHYDIQRNGKKVGDLRFKKQKAGSRTTYHIESDVKVSIIININVKAQEHSVYENEVLQSSSLVRHVNGKQKANKKTRNNGSGLTISDEGKEKELKSYLVRYNMHCLYSLEPVYFTNVFSDNYQKFIPIVKLANHHYKVTFPDGNSNEYLYENGICRKVKVRSQLFDADFVLTSL